MPQIKNIIAQIFILGMGSISLGTLMAYCSVTLTPMANLFNFSETESTWFNGSAMFCAGFGSLIMGHIAGRIQMRVAGLASGVVSIVTFIGLGLAKAKWLAFVCRFVSGMTIGFCSAIFPVFFSDIAPQGKQGLFGFISQIFICKGFLLPTLWDFFADWRLNYFLLAIFPFLLVLFIMFIPEPPKKKKKNIVLHLLIFLKNGKECL